jgi:phosphate/sulfate permease
MMDWWQVVLIVLASVAVGLLIGGLFSYLIARLRKKPFFKKRETIEVAEEQSESTAPHLLTELETNHRIATESRTDEMLPFETRVWDTSQDEVYKLTVNLREELAQAYLDMHQANDMVWLSTERGHRSQTLDEHYMNLCPRIAVRLERLMPLLKEQGNYH